jgi:hypothetical protein
MMYLTISFKGPRIMKTIIIGVILTLLVLALAYLSYIGVFHSVAVHEREVGPFILVYEEYTGDYKNTPRITEEIYTSLLEEDGIETYKGFGIYFDNPREVPAEYLRSEVGCILEPGDYEKIGLLRERYHIKEYPHTQAMVAEFPFRSRWSVIAGIMKVYPALERYRKEHDYPEAAVMEIYDVSNKRIQYIIMICGDEEESIQTNTAPGSATSDNSTYQRL